jgi:hypothetical protein
MTKGTMAIALDDAKAIYRRAVDPRASEGESSAWWDEVADEVRKVVAARSVSEAAGIIQWWHHALAMHGGTTCGSPSALAGSAAYGATQVQRE